MCAIIGWKGKLPKGVISKLLTEAESRGKDSTGIAFRNYEAKKTTIYRQAVSATKFVKNNQTYCGEARRSDVGLIHTRRASKGMPIDNENAHPFVHKSIVYAHNGKIDNWQDLRVDLIARFSNENSQNLAQYYRDAQTDSKVLGPYISQRNLADVKGCMGLVWIKGEDVYCFRSAKELSAAKVVWKDEDGTDQHLGLIASTAKIISNAFLDVKAEHTITPILLEENVVYKLNALEGVISEGEIPVNPANHYDEFTSEELFEDHI